MNSAVPTKKLPAHYFFTCPRCDGTGVYSGYGTCFRCEGRGKCLTKAGRAELDRRDRLALIEEKIARLEPMNDCPNIRLEIEELCEEADKYRTPVAV